MSTESARGTSVCVLAPVNCVFSTGAPMPMWRSTLKQKCPEQQQRLNTKNPDPPLSNIRNRPVVTATLPLGTEECLAWDQNQQCSGLYVSWHGGVAPLLTKHPHMGIKPIRISLMERPMGGGAETRGSYASEMFFAHKCSSFGNVREALKWNKGMNIGCIEYWPAGGVITWKTVSWPIFTPRLCSLCHRFPSEVWNFQQEVKVDSQSENSVTRLRLIHSQDQTGNSVYVFWNDTLRDKALRNGTYLQGIHTTHLHFDVEIHNWCFTLVEAFVMQEREDGQPKGGHMFEGKY